MNYQNPRIVETAELLKQRFETLENKASIVRAVELKALYDELRTLPPEERAGFGQEVNQLRQELQELVDAAAEKIEALPPIDVTAPYDVNVPVDKRPRTLHAEFGSQHPLMTERERMLDIFYRMGFRAHESRELDDDYHMFGALNFPEGHPARDDYDTFMTLETDKNGKRYIAPAHTSTMQNRILKQYKAQLEAGKAVAVVVPDRVFRNEDLDARHEHTFYQHEGIYVDKGVHAGHLMATLKTFLSEYYEQDIDIKTQPFYFPFTEPSFEFALSCPFCAAETDENGVKKGCHVCSQTGWIELLGCGMIHPNVLREAGIDPHTYTGFAWGGGIERLLMMKYNIEGVRHFQSGKLDFFEAILMSNIDDLLKRAEAIRLKYEESNAKNGKEAWRIRDYAMGFVGDVGDLEKLVMAKENLRDIDDVDAKLAHELADCLWSILVIANYYGVDLEKSFLETMDKITKRIDEDAA